jgi:hypothetical protein
MIQTSVVRHSHEVHFKYIWNIWNGYGTSQSFFLESAVVLWLSAVIDLYLDEEVILYFVRFEVFTAVTMKNGVFWDVTPCGSCKNRRFGGT